MHTKRYDISTTNFIASWGLIQNRNGRKIKDAKLLVYYKYQDATS